MRYIIASCGIILMPILSYCTIELTIQNTWERIDNINLRPRYKSCWMLSSVLEFKKKKAFGSFFLDKLIFSWRGNHFCDLYAALYKKPIANKFSPFQEHLVCESSWNASDQKLVFNINHPLQIEAETALYLVITVPQENAGGHFDLEIASLPAGMQESLSIKINKNSAQVH